MSLFKKYISMLNEGGFWGQGPSVNGSPTFQGTFFGFGGEKQLATTVTPAVKKMKKLEDMYKNIDHNTNTSSEPWPAGNKTSGFTGGEGGGGIRSGAKFPDVVSRIAFSAEEIKDALTREPKDEYWGFNTETDEETEESIEEQAQRGSPSDQNYRHFQGFPRHSSIEKSVKHVPSVENDLDNDGEEDVYLSDAEYVEGVLQMNGLSIAPKDMKRVMQGELEENSLSLKRVFLEDLWGGTEPYKRGDTMEAPHGDDWLIDHEDYSEGHASFDPADESPGGMTAGQIGTPKKFVPDDWEQRHKNTKRIDSE